MHIALERDGEVKNINLPFSSNNLYIDLLYSKGNSNKQTKVNDWYIDKESNLGVFHMGYYLFNDNFNEELRKFFTEVKNNNIGNISFDLRDYSGGRFDSVNPIFKYLNIDKYISFGQILRHSRCLDGVFYNSESYKDSIINPSVISVDRSDSDKSLIFKGNLYVIASNHTSDDAVTLASLFKINNLGIVVGEPTFSGPCQGFLGIAAYLPFSNITINFPYVKRIVPGYENINTLIPDIIINTSVDDFINGRDVQVEKIKELIRKKNM